MGEELKVYTPRWAMWVSDMMGEKGESVGELWILSTLWFPRHILVETTQTEVSLIYSIWCIYMYYIILGWVDTSGSHVVHRFPFRFSGYPNHSGV